MNSNRWIVLFALLFILVLPGFSLAQSTFPKLTFGLEESSSPSDFVLTMQIVFALTVLTLAPSILIMMTSFTRLVIVFHFLRQALATQTVPSNQILVGLALFITFFIMKPVLVEINETALQPYLQEQLTQEDALEKAGVPIRNFMLKQTRGKDLELFVHIRGGEAPASNEDVPLATLIPSFIISEIKTAFQIGFLLYLPMLLIDMIIASILLSMGMMMLPPIMISMPFKILLFVLVDGWYLIVESMVRGYG